MKVPYSMPLIDRERELAALGDILAGVDAGRGSVALLSGPAGSGKTYLIQNFCERIADTHATLLTAAASRAERRLSMGVVHQLFHSSTLPREFHTRVDELLGRNPVTDQDADSEPVSMKRPGATVAYELQSILMELCEQRPVAIAVDDLQHADGPSLQMLLFLQRRMSASRTLLLLGERPTVRSSHPQFRAELSRLPNYRKIRLELLSPSGVRALAGARLGPAAADEVSDHLHAVSGGSPLLLSALLDDHQANAALPGTVEAGEGEPTPGEAFRAALTGCLYRSEAPVYEVAQAIAALREAVPPSSIARILGIGTGSVHHAITSLTASGLLNGDHFRHPAACAVVLEEMAPDDRRELHLRTATVLHEDGHGPVRVAEQLRSADRAPEEWMIGVLRDAAEHELTSFRQDMACTYLELALRECADGRRHAALTADRMRIEWQRTPQKAMRHAGRLKQALHKGYLSGRDAAMLVRNLLWHGRTREAQEALARWEATGDNRATEERSILNGWLTYSHPMVADTAHISSPAVAHRTALTTTGSFDRHAAVMLSKVLADGASDEAVSSAEGILQSVRLDASTVEELHAALLTLIFADRPDMAAPWCDALLGEAAERNVPVWEGVFAAVRAEVAARQGDMATAVVNAKAAISRLSCTDWGVAIAGPVSNLVLALTLVGRLDEVVKYLKYPVPDSVFETRYGLHYLNARAHFHLATDRPAAALTDFESCGRMMVAWGLDLPAFIPWRSGAAEAQLLLGHRDRARALIEEQLTRPGTHQPRTQGISLRVLAAASELPDRLALLDKAVSLLQPDTARFELARALTDLSDACEQVGETERARELADRGAELMKSCHIPADWPQAPPVCRPGAPSGPDAVAVAGAHDMPGGSGDSDAAAREDGPTGVSALSEAERRVAELAAAGVTNRAIGRKLFITVSTVEQHLTRVYRKLSVSRRTDLAAKLAEADGSAETA
nr:LuxR-family transcriptional regulator [Streptomyces spiroverticillatus]